MKSKRTKRTMQDDSLNDKVINELSDELNIHKDKIHKCIQHFFQWQRKAFNDMEYESYLWNYFGTFSIIPKPYEKYINSAKYKKEQELKQNSITNDNKLNN